MGVETIPISNESLYSIRKDVNNKLDKTNAAVKTVRGKRIVIEDSIEAPLLINKWEKNLLQTSAVSMTDMYGMQYTVYPGKTISVTGTIDTEWVSGIVIGKAYFQKGKRYCVSGVIGVGEGYLNNAFSVVVALEDTNLSNRLDPNNATITHYFMESNLDGLVRFELSLYKGTYNDAKIHPMVEEVEDDDSNYPHSYISFSYDVSVQGSSGELETITLDATMLGPQVTKTFNGTTIITSPHEIEVTYATNEAGKNLLEMSLCSDLIPNPNLLFNPDFKVNQKGYSEYKQFHSGYFYHVDRWFKESRQNIEVRDNCLYCKQSAKNHFLGQMIDPSMIDYEHIYTLSCRIEVAKGYTLFMGFEGKQIAYIGEGIPVILTLSHYFSRYYLRRWVLFYLDGENAADENAYFKIYWAKLEYGNKATPFIPPNHAEELQRCKMYFEVKNDIVLSTYTDTWRVGNFDRKRIDNPNINIQSIHDASGVNVQSQCSVISGRDSFTVVLPAASSNQFLADVYIDAEIYS